MQERGLAARLRKAVERDKALADAARIRASYPENYVNQRLARVRKQIDSIDLMLDKCRDPHKLERLSAASERLSKLEFALAGRPMPGSLRPSKVRTVGPSSIDPEA